MDSREQASEVISNTQDDSLNNRNVVEALESMLHEKISDSRLQSNDELGITPIYHCQQQESWDCGIACLLMVSRWISPNTNVEYSSEIIPEEEQLRETLIGNIDAKSIWTADLVLELHKLLLQAESVGYIFCSKNMGVDESYKNFGYYRDNFVRDQGRVNDAFVQLQERSSSCFSTSHLPLPLVLNAVSHPKCIAIALVDNSKLNESARADKSDEAGYVGHYIVLCGCSSEPSHLAVALESQDGEMRAAEHQKQEDLCLVLMNVRKNERWSSGLRTLPVANVTKQPAQGSSPITYVLPSHFDRSWRASGTDDDIIFVIRQ